MMKKVTYLLTIMFAVALMSTSCEKDDPVVPDPVEITEGDLVGDPGGSSAFPPSKAGLEET